MNLLHYLDTKKQCGGGCGRIIYSGLTCLGCKARKKAEAQKRRYLAKKGIIGK